VPQNTKYASTVTHQWKCIEKVKLDKVLQKFMLTLLTVVVVLSLALVAEQPFVHLICTLFKCFLGGTEAL
jgi:hypothetical protein